jgi:hypothetical protein
MTRGKREKVACGWCTESFMALSIKVRAGGAKYCSKTCYNDKRKAHKTTNGQKNRKHSLQFKYGMTLEQFDELRECQETSVKYVNGNSKERLL